jgi:sec-independent protein translocase protein TatA
MGLDNPVHLAVLVVLLLLLFGAKRLPEIGRSLGSGMREFKQSISGEHPDQKQTSQQQSTLPAAPPQAPVQTASQAAAQASSAASAQDAFAQRDPASTEQR